MTKRTLVNIVLLLAVFAAAFLASRALAVEPPIPYRELVVQSTNSYGGSERIFRFVDPDNGNVCYYQSAGSGYSNISLSCVNPSKK